MTSGPRSGCQPFHPYKNMTLLSESMQITKVWEISYDTLPELRHLSCTISMTYPARDAMARRSRWSLSAIGSKSTWLVLDHPFARQEQASGLSDRDLRVWVSPDWAVTYRVSSRRPITIHGLVLPGFWIGEDWMNNSQIQLFRSSKNSIWFPYYTETIKAQRRGYSFVACCRSVVQSGSWCLTKDVEG